MMDREQMRLVRALRPVLEQEQLPAGIVDMEALDHNIDQILARLPARQTLRIGSKSMRVCALMRYVIERGAGRVRGLLTFDADETAYLAREQGFEDLLLAYPIARAREARLLAELSAEGHLVRVMVDDVLQLRLLEQAAAAAGSELGICLDIDMSLRPLRGALHLGVRRSPLRQIAQVRKLAQQAIECSHLRLDAVMGYEAQVAGLPDEAPDDSLPQAVIRGLKRRSMDMARARRARVRRLLEQELGLPLALFNGGGTGSLLWTGEDESVDEITIGSGFFCSHLFDHFTSLPLRPALYFALAVVRRPDSDVVTCHGGGVIASGPPAADRAPRIAWPPGLQTLSMEGFGEVQTPLQGSPARLPTLGDFVLCRPAKAGEVAERFEEYLRVRGEEVEGRAKTYRGLGQRFL